MEEAGIIIFWIVIFSVIGAWAWGIFALLAGYTIKLIIHIISTFKR